MENIWKDKVENKKCDTNCQNLNNINQCKIDGKEFQVTSMSCFYSIINDNRFETTKSFIFWGFLYYWIFMYILFLALFYTFAFELTLLLKTFFNLLQGDFQFLLNIFIIQIIIFGLALGTQIIRNKVEKKIKKFIINSKEISIIYQKINNNER